MRKNLRVAVEFKFFVVMSALSLIEGPVLSLPKDRRVASLYLC